jgi:hypothetical protein
MGDCFVPRSDISFGLLEKTFLDSYSEAYPVDSEAYPVDKRGENCG